MENPRVQLALELIQQHFGEVSRAVSYLLIRNGASPLAAIVRASQHTSGVRPLDADLVRTGAGGAL